MFTFLCAHEHMYRDTVLPKWGRCFEACCFPSEVCSGPPLPVSTCDLTHVFTGLKVFHQRPVLLFTSASKSLIIGHLGSSDFLLL